jgi:WD40 repeat protein
VAARQHQQFNAAAFATLVLIGGGCNRGLDTPQWEQRNLVRPHQIAIRSISFSPDGRQMATGGDDLTPPRVHVQRLGSAPGELSLTTTDDGSLRFGPLVVGDRVKSVGFADHGASIFVVLFGKPTRVLWFDALDGTQTEELARPADASFGAAVSRDGRLAAWACDADRIRIWDRVVGREVTTITATDELSGGFLRFSPDGRRLAARVGSWADDRTAIWDVKTGNLVSLFASPSEMVFSPDGHFIATETSGKLTLWDVATGEAIRHIAAGSDVDAIAFTPDGKRLVAAVVRRKKRLTSALPLAQPRSTQRAEFKVWTVADGAPCSTIRDPHSKDAFDRISALAFSPDGRTLALGDYTGHVRLWDVSAFSE